jgi:hypothetical protein
MIDRLILAATVAGSKVRAAGSATWTVDLKTMNNGLSTSPRSLYHRWLARTGRRFEPKPN